MRRLLNTLFVTTQGSYLARKGETVLVRADGETKFRFPVHNLEGIVCFGRVSWSPPLMHLCAENDVTISFLGRNGRYYGRVQGPVSGNVLLRRQQYRLADDGDTSAEVGKTVVTAKIANTRNVVLRARRDHEEKLETDEVERAVEDMARTLEDLKRAENLRETRGREGESARTYFGVFDELITVDDEAFEFDGRNRRPPVDPVNALLSFYYTLLLHDCVSALECVGLDPAVGFLHRDRAGRPGLALDLMEEFRAFLADRLTLSLINRRQLQADDFEYTESGAVNMEDEARKKVLKEYQRRKQQEIMHPFLDEKMEVGMLPYAQALLLSRYIRGEMDAYPPFTWR
ncbi:MAG: type I-C CRISPR-associated endonuclease Cas1c [Planctomycetota bacterium]